MKCKVIRNFPIKKTNLSFSYQAWIPRRIVAPSGWSQKSSTKCMRSSMIPSPCRLSPLHTILFSHTELRGFLKGNKLLHHQAFECAIYCLAFPLPPGHLQVSATVHLPRGHSHLLSPGVSLSSHSLLRLSTASGWGPSLTSLYSYGSTRHKPY